LEIPLPDIEPAIAKACKVALHAINAAGIPYLIGGGLAFMYYTKHPRSFNDLDLFCKAGDYPKILEVLAQQGFDTSIQDEKWVAKATTKTAQVDLIFSASNGVQVVDDSWLEKSHEGKLFGEKVHVIGPEELFWSKVYIQNSNRFDGPDIYHLILKAGETLDWRHILQRMEADWEILLAALTTFRFIFPSERSKVPSWLMEELTDRLQRQLSMPIPHDRICRGPLLSRTDYEVDIHEGGFIV